MRGWRADLGGNGDGSDGGGEEREEERSGTGADKDGLLALREARAGGSVRHCRIANGEVAGAA